MDGYLETLYKKLKGFSKFDRSVLIEEIGSHIESGEEDPALGYDPAQRSQKVLSELGSPEQMAKGFKRIYQPGSLIDYLLIAIPYLLNLPINLLLLSLMPKYHWADVRLVIVFHLILVGIGLWRKSTLLTVYWLADLTVQLMGVLWVAKGYFGTLQTGLWYLVLAGLIIQLGRMVWQNHRDLLIVIFALLPILMGVLALTFRIITHGNTFSYEPLEIFFFRLYLYYGNFIFFAEVLALAPFFMVRNRNVRWFALVVFWVLYGLCREWLDYNVIYASIVYYLWIFLPLGSVFLGWLLEYSKQRKITFAA